jgi:hypothetical protein
MQIGRRAIFGWLGAIAALPVLKRAPSLMPVPVGPSLIPSGLIGYQNNVIKGVSIRSCVAMDIAHATFDAGGVAPKSWSVDALSYYALTHDGALGGATVLDVPITKI